MNNQYALFRKKLNGTVLILWVMLMSASQLIGCAISTGLPTTKEMTAVNLGEKAIVLLRVECTIENQQSYEPFSSFALDDNISFGLGSFETGGKPDRVIKLRFLSPDSRRTGWTYFVLPYGAHYLAVYPPRRTDLFTYARSLSNYPSWRIDVPKNAKLVYAGTLRLAGESDWLLFGGRILQTIRKDKINVVDNRKTALKLLSEYFPESGEVQTVLMQRQEGPIILHSPLVSPGAK